MTENQTAPTPSEQEARSEAIRKGHSHALSVLKEKHKTEYNDLVKTEVKRLGFDWSPKKTQEEKDREAFEALLAANPQFAEIAKSSDNS